MAKKKYILRQIKNEKIHIAESKFSYASTRLCGLPVFDGKEVSIPPSYNGLEDLLKSTKICVKCCRKLVKEFGTEDDESYFEALLRIFKKHVEVKKREK